MGDLIDLIQHQGTDRFEIFSMESELVKAYEDPQTKEKRFKGVASSTVKDLHGDTITLSGLQDMERTAVGLTMFLNHSYEVPKDVGGTIDKAVIRQKGVDDNGDPAYVLDIEGSVEEDNPEALKTWGYVKKGRRIGLSIGAMIPKGGATRQKDGSYIIEHLQLLEVSFVGIPANPKSWVDYAASALRGLETKGQHTAQLGSPTIQLDTDKGTYKIEGSLGDLTLNLGVEEPEEPIIRYDFVTSTLDPAKTMISRVTSTKSGVTEESLGAWNLSDDEEKTAAIAAVGEEIVQKATVWVETRDGDKITIGDPPDQTASVSDDSEPDVTTDVAPDVTDASTCPTCGGTKGNPQNGCTNPFHGQSSAEPDVTDAKIRIIEVDTDAPASGSDGQGASSSEPDDSDTLGASPDTTADAQPVILDTATADELLTLSFRQLQAAALATLNELVETKRALDEEKQARAAAETEKQRVIDAAGELVRRVNEVLDKVADSPLTRKAVKTEARSVSASITDLYGEAFANALVGK